MSFNLLYKTAVELFFPKALAVKISVDVPAVRDLCCAAPRFGGTPPATQLRGEHG